MYEIGFSVAAYLAICAIVTLVTKRSVPHFIIYVIDSFFAFVMIFFSAYCYKLEMYILCFFTAFVSFLIFVKSYNDLNRYK